MNTFLVKFLRYFIAAVWFINGFFCKILLLVPRHQQIVATILGEKNSYLFTMLIGTGEVFMALWVLSKIKHRLCTVVQVLLVLVMNVIEGILVPELLLWHYGNAVFAFILILLIIVNERMLQNATNK